MDKQENSLKDFIGLQDLIDTAFNDGKRKGFAEGVAKGLVLVRAQGVALGILKVAKALKQEKFSIKEISELTGLSKEVIEKL